MNIAKVYEIVKTELSQQFEPSEYRMVTIQLLQHFWGINATDFYVNKQLELPANNTRAFTRAIEKLKQNKPLQYVLGEAHFCGLTFKVNQSVLIPRPETEELAQWIIDDNRHKLNPRIADIGCGSGCLAITLAKNINNALVCAMDVSPQAIETTMQNAETNGVVIDIACADLFLLPKISNYNFDIIVSNPPYVRNSEKAYMQPNVLNYEPPRALFVPDDNPLIFYSAIADFANLYLTNHGKIYVEINEALSIETAQTFIDKGFKTELRKDLSGKDRMLKIEK